MATTTTSSTSKLLLFTFLTFSYLTSTFNVVEASRNLEIMTVAADNDGAGNLMDCWNAALELKSCTDEIVKFFLNRNGTTEPAAVSGGVDKDCCLAIGLIAKDCRSVMFTSLGLTNMEGSNLKEYCDVQADKPELSPAPESTLTLSPRLN